MKKFQCVHCSKLFLSVKTFLALFYLGANFLKKKRFTHIKKKIYFTPTLSQKREFYGIYDTQDSSSFLFISMTPHTFLITGGAGYLGSHAVVAFEQAGYKTIILDNFSNASE